MALRALIPEEAVTQGGDALLQTVVDAFAKITVVHAACDVTLAGDDYYMAPFSVWRRGGALAIVFTGYKVRNPHEEAIKALPAPWIDSKNETLISVVDFQAKKLRGFKLVTQLRESSWKMGDDITFALYRNTVTEIFNAAGRAQNEIPDSFWADWDTKVQTRANEVASRMPDPKPTPNFRAPIEGAEKTKASETAEDAARKAKEDALEIFANAIVQGDVDTVTASLKERPSLANAPIFHPTHGRFGGSSGDRPLHLAARNGKHEIVKLLLARADVTPAAKNEEHQTAKDLAMDEKTKNLFV